MEAEIAVMLGKTQASLLIVEQLMSDLGNQSIDDDGPYEALEAAARSLRHFSESLRDLIPCRKGPHHG